MTAARRDLLEASLNGGDVTAFAALPTLHTDAEVERKAIFGGLVVEKYILHPPE